MDRATIAAWLEDARARTLELTSDLDDAQRMGPRLDVVNPLLWEVGHLAWFQERWTLRHLDGRAPLRADGDALYDSTAVAHETRWDLPLPSFDETVAYARRVLDEVEERLARVAFDEREAWFHALVVFHEDMHGEAFTYTRQTLGYPAPPGAERDAPDAGPCAGDAQLPGGTFELGAPVGAAFAFDNEQQAHVVELRPFRLARAPVTQGELRAFVEDGGYERDELWTPRGRAWRAAERRTAPVYWRREGGSWLRRSFDREVALEEHRPALHVCAHEADAYCAWAGRRLPTEAEWEHAASLAPGAAAKRVHPWGAAPPDAGCARLDGARLETADVGAHAAGDSAAGCRQMCGNVWEWTASAFEPYTGFVPGPYAEYSEPWFGDHRVLRGGAWATRGRVLRNTWRNFYTPDRADVLAGFRTAARDE